MVEYLVGLGNALNKEAAQGEDVLLFTEYEGRKMSGVVNGQVLRDVEILKMLGLQKVSLDPRAPDSPNGTLLHVGTVTSVRAYYRPVYQTMQRVFILLHSVVTEPRCG